MNRKTPLLIAVLASAALSAHAQNLLTNPGFETSDFTGWTPVGCQVDGIYVHSGRYSAHLGHSLNCSPFTCGGTLDQTITTVVGQLYHVDFWLANDSLPAGLHNSIVISFAGVTILSRVDSPGFPYTHFLGHVRATSASSLLHFSFSHSPHFPFFYAWYLDDVSVAMRTGGGSY